MKPGWLEESRVHGTQVTSPCIPVSLEAETGRGCHQHSPHGCRKAQSGRSADGGLSGPHAQRLLFATRHAGPRLSAL